MKMIINILISLLVLMLLSCSTKDNRPNFVFILVDDLGWADVACNFPETFYETPNIDRLAARGVLFAQAYSAHPVCSPTRGAIMTGKHPNRLGITDWIPGNAPKDRLLLGPGIRNELGLEEITLAEKLKEKGYRTCFIGKWHLGGEGYYPEDQGFDINLAGHDKGSPPGGYYSPYKNPKLTDGPEGEYLTDRLTGESIRFISENREFPFLLFLSFYTVHTPIQASKKHFEKYRQKREALNIDEIPHKREGMGWTKLIQEDAAYASMVAAMDENVGRLLETLENLGLDKNTWVIFTSDNGGLSTLHRQNAPTHNGPLRAGKGWCYEGGIRVPLIISGPSVADAGRTSNQPVVSMDFYPTIMELAGIEPSKTDGENLLPILVDQKNIDRETLFWHYPHYHGSAWTPGSALRKGDWKLVFFYEGDRTELFDLSNDPGEKTDLSERYPEMTKALKEELLKLLEESNAEFPRPNITAPDADIKNKIE